jgi:hypothetical protein
MKNGVQHFQGPDLTHARNMVTVVPDQLVKDGFSLGAIQSRCPDFLRIIS